MEQIRLNIKHRREELGLTQAALAADIEELGKKNRQNFSCSGATVSRDEKGSRTITLERLGLYAEYFKCSVLELIDDVRIASNHEVAILRSYRQLSNDERAIALRVLSNLRPNAA